DPRLHREKPATERARPPPRSARRTRELLDPHSPRRYAEGRRRGANERRLVLDGRGRSRRHARRVPGGELSMARALINAPAKAKRGEVIEIKTLISHIMETGLRPDSTGKPGPRDIITAFICRYTSEGNFP